MQGRMIDPAKVPEMFRKGTLWHGVELEFWSYDTGWQKGILYGYNPKFEDDFSRFRPFIGSCGWAEKSRFPLPDLRMNDPIIVKIQSRRGEDRRYFGRWRDSDEMVDVWCNGVTSWSASTGQKFCSALFVRIPTPDELEAAGLDRNHFAGRRGIIQEET